ncbi:uncharacterized protein [Diadema antillarum]|uniref:uncharacterized protein n=2 Tax=Diadema antillarum TaxID=105358 RepID=UPI003A86C7C5
MDLAVLTSPKVVSSCFFVAAFLIACSRGRQFWLLADFLATTAFGLAWFFLPQVLLGFQISKVPDGTHLTYTRAFGACMIGDAVSRYFIRSSRDNSAQVFLLLSRIIGCSVLLVAMVIIQYTGGEWNEMHIFFGMMGNLVWMMGSAVYYFQSRFSGGHAQLESQLNFHLRADGFLMLLLGCAAYGFPDMSIRIFNDIPAVDSAHIHMIRSAGALEIGSALLSFFAPGFLFEEDKRALLVGRVAAIVMTVLAAFYASANYEGWGQNLLPFLVGEGLIVLNALLGYFAPHETDRYKSK